LSVDELHPAKKTLTMTGVIQIVLFSQLLIWMCRANVKVLLRVPVVASQVEVGEVDGLS
jgi:hypothetical protein